MPDPGLLPRRRMCAPWDPFRQQMKFLFLQGVGGSRNLRARPYIGAGISLFLLYLFVSSQIFASGVRVSVQTLHYLMDGFRPINLFPHFVLLIRCNLAARVWAGDTTLSFLSPCFSVQIVQILRRREPRKVWKTVAELAMWLRTKTLVLKELCPRRRC